jgi:hypothetical protein
VEGERLPGPWIEARSTLAMAAGAFATQVSVVYARDLPPAAAKPGRGDIENKNSTDVE